MQTLVDGEINVAQAAAFMVLLHSKVTYAGLSVQTACEACTLLDCITQDEHSIGPPWLCSPTVGSPSGSRLAFLADDAHRPQSIFGSSCSEKVCFCVCRVRRPKKWQGWQRQCKPRLCLCTPPVMVSLLSSAADALHACLLCFSAALLALCVCMRSCTV